METEALWQEGQIAETAENTQIQEEIQNTTDQPSDAVSEPSEPEILEPDQEFLDQIQAAIDAINEWAEEPEDEPSEPVMASDESEDFITEEDIEKLDEAFSEMEEINSSLTEQLKEKEATIDDLNELIESKDKDIEIIEEAWAKVVSHPIIWPMAKKIIAWEEVDIPSMVEDKIKEELDSIPNLDESIPAWSKEQKQITLQDVFAKTPDWVN